MSFSYQLTHIVKVGGGGGGGGGGGPGYTLRFRYKAAMLLQGDHNTPL